MPESYVGSGEHVADLTDLAEGAPRAVSKNILLVRDYVDENVDPSRPNSQLTDTWPNDVQTAANDVTAFADRNCEEPRILVDALLTSREVS